MTARRAGLILLFVLTRAASADSDGHFCISEGYVAYELREWSAPEGKHVLRIVFVGGPEGISEPATAPLEDFQVHGMACAAHGIVVLSWDRKYTLALTGREPLRVSSVESFPAGRIPAGHAATSFGSLRKSRTFDVPSGRKDRGYELRIGYREIRPGPDRPGAILHETTTALVEKDESGRILREKPVHKAVEEETID